MKKARSSSSSSGMESATRSSGSKKREQTDRAKSSGKVGPRRASSYPTHLKKAGTPKTDRKHRGSHHTINGVSVVTEDGMKPSSCPAQGFVEGSRIKLVRLFQNVRSEGIGDIDALTHNIRSNGILEPLVVRPSGDGKSFELIAGERRLKSAKAVGRRVWGDIPIIIRPDLEGEDDKALAVAVAENSPDGRSNLNLIDIGRQAVHLKRKGWALERMATEMGLHEKTVRRALDLQDTTPKIQEKVRTGVFSARAALELHRLPPKIQEAMEDHVGPHTTVAAIRLKRKRLEREEVNRRAEKGLDITRRRKGHDGKAGRPLERGPVAWRSATEQRLQIGQLSYALRRTETGCDAYHEIRGALGAALWSRGDLDDALLPSIHEDEMQDKATEGRINEIFNQIVANEATRHERRAERSI